MLPEYIDFRRDSNARTPEFFRYYSKKRAAHQHMQLSMLKEPAIAGLLNLVEIGPYLGYATGIFMAAGFNVKTIDFCSGNLGSIKTEHIEKSVDAILPDDLNDTEIIVCCETLEHVEWDVAVKQIKVFKESGAKYFLMSVPCSSWYFNFDIAWTLKNKSAKLALKAPRFYKKFTKEAGYGHKWELGYKGFSPSKLFAELKNVGWDIVKTDYEVKNRSMFFLCKSANK